MLKISSFLFEMFKKIFYSEGFLMILIGVILCFILNSLSIRVVDSVGGLFSRKDIPTLKSEIALQQSTIEKLEQTIKEKDSQRGIASSVNKETIATIVEVIEKDNDIKTKVDKTKAEKRERLEEINHLQITEEEKVVLESIETINSIISVYCQIEPRCERKV